MELALNGIKVSVADAEIADLVRERLLRPHCAAEAVRTHALPEIGASCDGGLYAGLTLHDGQPHQLVLLPDDHDDMKWKDAIAWAEKQGGTLPSRIDMLVLWQNLKAQFKAQAYWTCEQHADDESFAWAQHFNYGGQYYLDTTTKLRARAVRRIPIE